MSKMSPLEILERREETIGCPATSKNEMSPPLQAAVKATREAIQKAFSKPITNARAKLKRTDKA